MDKKRLKRLIRGKESPNRGGKSKGQKRKNNFAPGDIVVYDSIIKDPLWKDENDGKIYLCLGSVESEELGTLGTLISGSFPDLRVIAVLEEGGDVKYVLPDELSPAGKKDEET